MVPGTEICPDTCLDPEGRAGTLQQRLLKRAGYIQKVQKGRVVVVDRETPKGPGSLGNPPTWLKSGMETGTSVPGNNYKHLYISADLTALIIFSFPNSKIKLA